MIIDEYGLPIVTGASDKQDSAVIAGLMTIFEYPIKVDMIQYILPAKTLIKDRDNNSYSVFSKDIYVRHPHEYKFDLSRDQFLLLSAGLHAKGLGDLVDTSMINGIDLLSPAVYGHIRRCKGIKANCLQNGWLWYDVWHHAKKTPTSEPNQLLAMMLLADKKYLKWWTTNNPEWERSIRKYWYTEDGAWRAEPDLAEHMITYIKNRIKEV